MKKQLILSVFCGIILGTASAQKIILKTYIEKTHISPKAGISIGFENRYAWEFGVFFQKASMMESFLMSETKKKALPKNYEKQFGGAYFAVPIIYAEKWMVKLQVRTGVSNGENFVITPTVLADYRLIKNIWVGTGLGTRALRTTFQGYISFKL